MTAKKPKESIGSAPYEVEAIHETPKAMSGNRIIRPNLFLSPCLDKETAPINRPTMAPPQ